MRWLAADLRLRAWCRSACSLRCRRSLATARSLFPAQSLSGLPVGVSLLPPHRMSGELVKTALADRPSVKPLQSVSVSCRHRMGCRMMSPLAACPPSASCAAIVLLACLPVFSSASLIRLVLPVLAMLAYSLRLPPRLSCRRAGRPSSRCHLVMRLACRRDTIADVIASFLRSVATVPPPPRLACAVGCLSCRVCAILRAVAIGTFRLVAFVPRSHKPHW